MSRTDLENFRATVNHERPGRILYSFSCTPDLDRRLKEHIGTDDVAGHFRMDWQVGVGLEKPESEPELDFSRYWDNEELPEGTKIDANGVAQVPSGLFHFWGYISPLRNAKSLSELEEYPMHDLSRWSDAHMADRVKEIHAQGKVAVAWIGHMYETAWQIRGYEQFLMDMLERPAWAECLLQRLADNNLIVARAAARAGVDLIRTGDDVANQKALMFSPDLWRRMMLSKWAKVWEEAKSISPEVKIWYHSDGNISAIIPDLIEAGLDILNPVQPECMDLDQLHARYGSRLCFDGTIGTQSTMPWGTPNEVRERVKEVIEKYGTNGGLFVSPTHVLEPEVPIANIEALVAACQEYGTFEA